MLKSLFLLFSILSAAYSVNDTAYVPWDYATLELAVAGKVALQDYVTDDKNVWIIIDSAFQDGGTQITLSYTGNATHRLYIETTSRARHSGIYSDSKYRLVISNTNMLYFRAPWVVINGLQLSMTSTNGSDALVYFYDVDVDGNALIKNCIFKGPGDCGGATYTEGIQIFSGAGKVNVQCENCLVYNWYNLGNAGGLVVFQAACTLSVYNCTFNKCAYGVYRGNGNAKVQNCVFYANTADLFGSTYVFDSTCATSLTGAGGITSSGRNNRLSQEFTFIDSSNNDFHLDTADTAARERGDDLSSMFTTDVDGQTRPANDYWDIGFDEAEAVASGPCTEPVLSYSQSSYICTVGVAANVSAAITGSSDSCTISPSLPSDFTFTKIGESKGGFSGTPTLVSSAKVYTVRVYGCETYHDTSITVSVVYNPCKLPVVEDTTPSPGHRVWQQLSEYSSYDSIRHMIYLPPNYNGSTKLPVIVELPGNTNNAVDGPTSNYWATMGYGMSRGNGFVWISVPFLNSDGTDICYSFWEACDGGGSPTHTVAYVKLLVSFIKSTYAIDTTEMFLVGFSRGSVATALIGAADDTIAAYWKGFHMSAYGDCSGYGGACGPRISRIKQNGIRMLLTVGATDGYLANMTTYAGLLDDSSVVYTWHTVTGYAHNIRWIDDCSNEFSDSSRLWLLEASYYKDTIHIPEDCPNLKDAIDYSINGRNISSEGKNIYVIIDSSFDDNDTNVTIDFTGDSIHFVYIDVNDSVKHHGVYDTTKYRISIDSLTTLTIKSPFICISGIQFNLSKNKSSNSQVDFYGINSNGRPILYDCIFKGPGDGQADAYTQAIRIYSGTGHINLMTKNCVAYNWTNIEDAGAFVVYQSNCTLSVYNCTFNECDHALHRGDGGGFIRSFNNLFYGCSQDYGSTYDLYPQYCYDSSCATTNDSVSSGLTGKLNRYSQSFSFIDSVNKDFHIDTLYDTAAFERGVSLDSYFTDDIDGQNRPIKDYWDIGADEGDSTTYTEEVYGIDSIRPNPWYAGKLISIYGNFPSSQGTDHITFSTTSLGNAQYWSSTRVDDTIPYFVPGLYPVYYYTDADSTLETDFRVVRSHRYIQQLKRGQ